MTQWSFPFAYQWMPDYHDDTGDKGEVGKAGLDDYEQLGEDGKNRVRKVKKNTLS